jgi:hypothetical protein
MPGLPSATTSISVTTVRGSGIAAGGGSDGRRRRCPDPLPGAITATLLLGAVLAMAGCGASSSTAASASTALRSSGSARVTSRLDSGIRGRVLYGPTCPVQRAGQVCVRPYSATIAIRSYGTGRLITRVRSNAAGRFRVALRPGRYVLQPARGHPYPRSSALTVTVRKHHFTNVTITYDSGIR